MRFAFVSITGSNGSFEIDSSRWFTATDGSRDLEGWPARLLVVADLNRRPRPAGGRGRELEQTIGGRRVEGSFSARGADLGRHVPDHDGLTLGVERRRRRATRERLEHA